MFKERGEALLLRFAQALEDYGKVEQLPQLDGKRMVLYISPKPGAGSAKKATDKANAKKDTKQSTTPKTNQANQEIDNDNKKGNDL